MLFGRSPRPRCRPVTRAPRGAISAACRPRSGRPSSRPHGRSASAAERSPTMPARLAALLLLALALGIAPALAAPTEIYALPEGAGPHDTAPAPDGTVWYTAQGMGALGILDPATGEVRQVPLGEGSAPHGVIRGPDGAAWITDGGQNAIVRYDPSSGDVRRWPLPADAGFANLNTATFDHHGMLWFTGQS